MAKVAYSDTLRLVAPSLDGPIPAEYGMLPNFPNPFNLETEIVYGVPKESYVRLAMYDLLGREVRILLDRTVAPGYRVVRWDGKDEFGNVLPSGIYIYRFDHPEGSIVRKMLLLK